MERPSLADGADIRFRNGEEARPDTTSRDDEDVRQAHGDDGATTTLTGPRSHAPTSYDPTPTMTMTRTITSDGRPQPGFRATGT